MEIELNALQSLVEIEFTRMADIKMRVSRRRRLKKVKRALV